MCAKPVASSQACHLCEAPSSQARRVEQWRTWHWRTKWDLTGVIWSLATGGGGVALWLFGCQVSAEEPIWLVNYPWKSKKVRGGHGWQSPLSLLCWMEAKSIHIDLLFLLWRCQWLLRAWAPSKPPDALESPVFWGGLWAWSWQTLVIILSFLYFQCVTLSRSSLDPSLHP